MNHESPDSTITFLGGLQATVTHEDGSTETIKIRQLRLADYELAIPLLNDEFALTAFCCQSIPSPNPDPGAKMVTLTKPWVMTLEPSSYEVLRARAEEVNAKGFFSFATRRTERERDGKKEMFEIMSKATPEALSALVEVARSASIPPSPRRQ